MILGTNQGKDIDREEILHYELQDKGSDRGAVLFINTNH
jgi:hypothetical protein